MTKRVVSPESTGGAGGSFETRVAAIGLARMLRGDHIPGLAAPPVLVRLQQKFADAVLDDIVFDTEKSSGTLQSIEYEVKRSLSVTPKDPEFVGIVGRCFAEVITEDGSIASGHRRFGIASRETPNLVDLKWVTEAARAHHSAEPFAQLVSATAGGKYRDRLGALTAAVRSELPEGASGAMVADLTWQVARALFVWPVDGEPDSSDVRAAIDQISDLTIEPTEAGDVFRSLVTAAQAWAPKAATIDGAMLRARLDDDGHSLDAAPRLQAAFRRLEAASAQLVDQRRAVLGRQLHLERTVLRRAVRRAIDDSIAVLLAGRAGVGKSVMSRLVAQDLIDDGAVAVFIDLVGQRGGLAQLELELGVSLRNALAGGPIGGLRVVVIDGIEQALTDGSELLTAILRAIPSETSSAPGWRILLAARDEATVTLDRVVTDEMGGSPSVFRVGELTDDEVAQILDEFPRLEAVGRNPRARALLLRRPYLVELLVRAGVGAVLPTGILGEEDVLAIVSQRLIRLDDGGLPGEGAPFARADIYQQLGSDTVANQLPASLARMDSPARSGLRSDDIIEEHNSRWRFAHDILEDYAAAQRLLESDGSDLLARAPEPRRLLRAAQLRVQRELADALDSGELPAAWASAIADTEALARSDGPRWADTPWQALLHLGAAREATNNLTADLLRNDGHGLRRLIDVTQLRARTAAAGSAAGGPPPLDTTLSGPVVDLLVSLSDQVPPTAIDAALSLVHDHLEATRDGAVDRLAHCGAIPDAVLAWAGDNAHGDLLDHAIGALAHCAAVLEERHEHYLVATATRRPHTIAAAIENPPAAAALAAARPELLVRLASLYYLGHDLTAGPGHPLTTDHSSPLASAFMRGDREGVREHSVQHGNCSVLATPGCGPFAALLEADLTLGVKLIGAVVDAATTAREHIEAGWTHRIGPEGAYDLDLTVPGSPPKQFRGNESVWLWHRRTATGPNPALSALMALRARAVQQIKDGHPPHEVRDTVLSAGTSLGFVSVAVSALVDQIDRLTDELDPFLAHPLVWLLELHRVTAERGLALDIPEAHNLSWTMRETAISLMVRGDQLRKDQLRAVGDDVITHTDELHPSDRILATRFASELDSERLVFRPHDDRSVAVDVDYPEGLIDELNSNGGTAATRAQSLAGAVFSALQIRDHHDDADPSQANALWQEIRSLLEAEAEAGDGFELYTPQDAMGLGASALVVAAHDGHAADPGDLHEAVAFTLEGADFFAVSLPTAAQALAAGESSGYDGSDMMWEEGVDRSIATALPLLLLNSRLRDLAGISLDDIRAGLTNIATSPLDEVRARLRDGLLAGWDEPCDTSEQVHQALLDVARTMVATSGKVQIVHDLGYGFADALLAEPLETTIAALDGNDLNTARAAFGLTIAAAGSSRACMPGRTAQQLTEVLIAYDHRIWPVFYARRTGLSPRRWRHALDAHVADQVMAGDDAALTAHLDSLECVAEELVGFLEALVHRAVDHRTAGRLHLVWRQLLDRLLPADRNLDPRPGGTQKGPRSYAVDSLDNALLLMPEPETFACWPAYETQALGKRWLAAYGDRPEVADRAIRYLLRMGELHTNEATTTVLRILGSDLRSIRSTRLVYAWLREVITEAPARPSTAGARVLLDRLVAAGDQTALCVQTELEG